MSKTSKSARLLVAEAGDLIRIAWLKLVDAELANTLSHQLTAEQIHQLEEMEAKLLVMEHQILDILIQAHQPAQLSQATE